MQPLATEAGSAYDVEFYATEEEARQRATQVRASRATYLAGPLMGAPCGREPSLDRDGLFAVSVPPKIK